MNTMQSQHWLDKVTANIDEWQTKQQITRLHVDDMKTPSGRVHTGALRGVVLHDLVAKALAASFGKPITSSYVFNDMDPMDSLPGYLPKEKFASFMGIPLCNIPAPSLKESGVDFSKATTAEKKRYEQAKSFGEFYALDFIDAFRHLGCSQKLVWSHELYESGKMDTVIKVALDSIETIRTIYKNIADYTLPKNWYPFQVICPTCGKVSTTLTTGWNGTEVTFECQLHKVEWATGCGLSGSISPFSGTGKLLWKVDWPAHWTSLGVNVEGAGKDHTSAGGSRDMANALCRQVFGIEPPFDIPYEWIVIRGAKMSSSKGVGTSAREFVQLFPPTIGRFLFASKDCNQVIDFDPTTMSIPDLFDEYDQAARIFWKQAEGDLRMGRAFAISQIGTVPEPHFLPRFRDIALWMQYPEIEVAEKCAEIKGAPLTELEKTVVQERLAYAQVWVTSHAPEEYQFSPKEQLPEQAREFTAEQIAFLADAVELVENQKSDPQVLQQALFERAKASIGPSLAFQSIYIAFLGKTAGPRAAWFLLSISPDLRKRRIAELQNSTVDEILTNQLVVVHDCISLPVKKQFPGIFFAYTKISGVQIKKNHLKLQAQIRTKLAKLASETMQHIGQRPAIQAYRKLFTATGTDFHSKRPSPEALLRRIAQGKGIYQINTAVDAYNVAVLESGVGLGGFNADQVSEPVVLRFSTAGEHMQLLGDSEPTSTRAGQLVYADATQLLTIDLNYRDIDATKITPETTNILLFADGAPDLPESDIIAALQKGADYIQLYCGGIIGELHICR